MKEVTDKIKCLYYIKDLRTDKIIYIGQTSDFNKRKRAHFCHKDQCIDEYMYNESRENFVMKIFTNIDTKDYSNEDLRKKEDELIIYYDTINNGFNKKRSGFISKNKNHVKEYMHNYNISHREEHKEYMKEYSKTEKWKEYWKKYYQEHL